MSEVNLDWISEHQLRRLDEMLIVVDEDDKVIGVDTKRNCHLNENIEKGGTRVSLLILQDFLTFFSPERVGGGENLGFCMRRPQGHLVL